MDDELAANLTKLFRSHHSEVLAYCVRRIGWDDAEEAASEVFAVAARRVGEIEWETARPWLYGVAKGVLANRHRAQRRSRSLIDKVGGWAEVPHDSPDELVVRGSEAEAAIRTLRTLRSSDREILMLAAWEGLGTAEIAASMGITVQAAEKRLERARGRFAQALVPRWGGLGMSVGAFIGRGDS
jgi:RNA polymerase sigma factor (sigma-70 family)